MDTTSLNFEGLGGQSIGQHGYSNNHRPDLRQMILAVLIDSDGRPVCSQMWPGNTADVTSLVPVIERLRQRFAIGRVCIVADRGMISAETIATLEARGLLYILGVRERSDKLVREVVLGDAAPFVPLVIEKRGRDTEYGAKAVTLGGARYIVCITHQEAAKDAAERAANLAALERQLRRGDKALVGNTGYRRFLKTAGKDHFAIDRAKAAADARFDGIFVLRTNTDLSPLAAMLRYKATSSSGPSSRASAPPSICSPHGRSSTSSMRPFAAMCSAASSPSCSTPNWRLVSQPLDTPDRGWPSSPISMR
jgi:Transposase DDE domain